MTPEEYDRYDLLGLADLVRRSEITPEELLDCALARMAAVNPKINAMGVVAEETARRHINAGLPQGPFRGVPFLLKDLGAEAIDFPAHNGSQLLKNTHYTADSELYIRLRNTGLVVFGRTTSPEGGIGPVTEASVYGGPTRNPWDTERTSGGSSGGSGAAVAAGIVPAAHGSDGGGSVRIPASSCGLFGMKPTRARLPDGPFAGEGWAGMAIDGYLTRSVRDTAALLDATAGPDLGAPYVAPPLRGTFKAAAARRPNRLKIAYMTTDFRGGAIHPECREAVENTATLLADMGHQVEDAAPVADHDAMMRAWTRIVACGTLSWARAAAAKRGVSLEKSGLQTVAQGACEMARDLSGADYLDAINVVHGFGRQMAGFFLDYDVLLTATLGEPPALVGRFSHDRSEFADFQRYRVGDDGVFAYSPFTAAYNATGQPAASLPVHWTPDDLPVGVQIATAFGEDELLLSLAAEIEKARPWFDRRPDLTGT